MGKVENEERDSGGLGGRERRQGARWRRRVAAASSTEAGIQAHDPAVLAVNVHGASLQRTWRRLGCCRESIGVVQEEPVSPAPLARKRDGTQGLPQAWLRAYMGNEAQNQETQRRQLGSHSAKEV